MIARTFVYVNRIFLFVVLHILVVSLCCCLLLQSHFKESVLLIKEFVIHISVFELHTLEVFDAELEDY